MGFVVPSRPEIGVAYAVVGWLIAQVATQIFPFLEIPNWAIRLVVLLIVIGFPAKSDLTARIIGRGYASRNF